MYKIAKTILFISIAGLYSCMPGCQESALSDVALIDPSILSIHATVEKSTQNDGTSTEQVEVWVRDKNTQPLTLKDGKVMVNGKDLSVFRSFVGKLPYYKATGSVIDIKAGEKYLIDVQMADGKKYSSSINIPEKNIQSINCPTVHKGRKDLRISWNEVSTDYELLLSWVKKAQSDTAFRTFSGSQALAPGTSNHEFPSSFFKEGDYDVVHLDLTLSSMINGQVSPAFRTNSSVEGVFKINKSIVIE